MKLAYAGMWFMNILIILLLPFIMQIYHLSPNTSWIASKIIMYHAVCSSVIWVPSFTLPNTLRAADDVGFCMWVSILSMWIFRIGFSFVLGKYLGMGVFGIWVAMTIDWLFRTVFFVVRYRGSRWQRHKIED